MAFDKDKYRDTLLMSIPNSRLASGGKEIVCRCKYCPDSLNLNHGHFYISIPEDDEPSLFYCQKCKSSGIVDSNTLIEWNIFDVAVSIDITKYNKRIMKLTKNKKFINNDTVYNIMNTKISQNEWSDKKLAYINNRLGLNFTYEDIIRNKIVLNLNDLLVQNNITELTRYKQIVDQLDRYFLGFLSYDNGFVNMRRLLNDEKSSQILSKNIDKRYVNYNIFGKYNNTKRFYVSPVNLNLNDPRPIQVHLAEGVFDLLSIKYNLRKEENAIYSSINGSGYFGMLKFFIISLKLINMEIHIYPDKDIDDRQMYNIARQLEVFNNPIYIHRNIMDGEKDFGVRPERINEFVQRIL